MAKRAKRLTVSAVLTEAQVSAVLRACWIAAAVARVDGVNVDGCEPGYMFGATVDAAACVIRQAAIVARAKGGR